MKQIITGAILMYWLLVCVSSATGGSAPKRVTLESLLREMVDRDAVVKRPVPAYVLKQASSHDTEKRDPGNPQTWHSNHDLEQFLRVEVHEGRREWVIMDDAGPGAITRFWLPLLADRDNQTIRFYFDGDSKPAIEAKFNDLLSGRGFVPPPFAFVAWNDTDIRGQKETPPKTLRGVAGDMYLPIPFARHCKITLDSLPFYYIINYRAYAPGTAVQTFTLEDFKAAAGTIERVGSLLTSAPASRKPALQEADAKTMLAPGGGKVLDLENGSRALRALQLQIDPKDAPQALRSLVLEMTFDDEPTVWCPLGEFFGCGPRLHAAQDWYRSVGEDGKLTARWVMPYQRKGRIVVKNLGLNPASLSMSAVTTPWHWDERSLVFHANWHCETGIKTRPYFDWNYIDIQGEGVYVGDTLSAFTPVGEWYGEGDERVYVDGETFPSHIGTGTEDYYGYAWGMATYFSSPFLSTPLRDTPDRDDWRGYTTTSRLRLLDGIPMRTGLKLDMEIWNWADTQVDYAVATFWYARPGAKHNRVPQPTEAALPVRAVPIKPGAVQIAGAIECEALPIVASSPGIQTSTQNAGLKQGGWSGGRQLFVQAAKSGDYIELAIPTPDDQPRRMILYGTKSFDYAVLRFRVNGQQAGADYDAYSAEPVASGPIDLGVHAPRDGKLLLRVEAAVANPKARGKGTYFGLDCVTLQTLKGLL